MLALPAVFLLQGVHLVSDVQHFLQEIHVLPRYGNLLVAGHGPEAVFKIVLLVGAQSMHVAVGAVVVSDDETGIRNHAAGASEVERDYGVRNRGPLCVRIVDFFC